MDNNTWARNDKEKAETFTKYLKNVFTPFISELTTEEDMEINEPLQLSLLNGFST